jgi:hypothetical protein
MGVETALMAGGLAMSAGGTATSFINAGKQNKIMAKAEADAQKSLDEAKKQISVNAYKGLSVNKDPYNKERDALVASGAQSIEAGKESNRGAAATAGRVQMAQNDAQAGIQASQSKEEKQLDMLVANEDSRIKDMIGQISLQTAQGSQLQARDAKFAQSKDLSGAFAGMGAMGKELISMAPLYSKTADHAKSNVGNNDTQSELGSGGAGSDNPENFQATGSAPMVPENNSGDAPSDFESMTPDKQLSFLQDFYQKHPDKYKQHMNQLGLTA